MAIKKKVVKAKTSAKKVSKKELKKRPITVKKELKQERALTAEGWKRRKLSQQEQLRAERRKK